MQPAPKGFVSTGTAQITAAIDMAFKKEIGTDYGIVRFKIVVESPRSLDSPPSFSLIIDASAKLLSTGDIVQLVSPSNIGFNYQKAPTDENILEALNQAVDDIVEEFKAEQAAPKESIFENAGWAVDHE